MLESTFLEDWDEIGTKMAKKGHLLPKSGINSELVSIQRVNDNSPHEPLLQDSSSPLPRIQIWTAMYICT